ncbi:MAG: DUF4236 domain-containing protein [Proteobacteria bacterium]|nr:DUF4236 domain-containing protein [Pseudomonadota bacterium]
MPLRFHRVISIIPGLLRINLSKGGLSGSVGPRGADINIGKQGITTNAGLPGTGLSYRQKLGVAHGSGIGVGLFIAALAFAGYKYFAHSGLPNIPGITATQQTTSARLPGDDSGSIPRITRAAHAHHAQQGAGADVIAAAKPASGTMYVRRNNSDLRPAPSTSSEAIRKLAKGDTVTLIALSDKWAEVDDHGTKGWVRASILKDTPPGTAATKKAD